MMNICTDEDKLFQSDFSNFPTEKKGRNSWSSPSNIALVKYWGKYGDQFPSNPSLSLTLEKSCTLIDIEWDFNKDRRPVTNSITFLFDGKTNDLFQDRIYKVIKKISARLTYLPYCNLKINSKNTFPHSVGIASSASSMSALALSLLTIEYDLKGESTNSSLFFQKASYLARLGSGSACRSLFPFACLWGEYDKEPGANIKYGVPFLKSNEIYKNLQDSILIVDSEPKLISSSSGHLLMNGHPYAEMRFSRARNNLDQLIQTLINGDVNEWGKIIESEALELHALMMMSSPPYILAKPNTFAIIDKIKSFRKKSKIPVFFTLDAGPNIHLLYPNRVKDEVVSFIKSELDKFLVNGEWIDDKVGDGPKRIDRSFSVKKR